MSNSFGRALRLTSFGESHGVAMGGVVDGCPAGFPFPLEAIRAQLARRRPGQSAIVSQRNEPDELELLSGVHPKSGRTLGTPIAFLVRNSDARGRDYDALRDVYRPSHADFSYDAKYGLRAESGGGRASARETLSRVVVGALAEALLQHWYGTRVLAWVERIGEVDASGPVPRSREDIDATPVRGPTPEFSERLLARIEAARRDGDSVGGVVRCAVEGVPPGLGDPVFDKLTATLAHGLMSLPATRGVEFGAGFAAAQMTGSEHNDPFEPDGHGGARPQSNHAGGILGGISSGAALRLAVAFKPTATIFKPQDTVTRDGVPHRLEAKGRHDPCVVPRAVPLVEAMVAWTLCDHALRHRGSRVDP